jgi:hypothetical protein
MYQSQHYLVGSTWLSLDHNSRHHKVPLAHGKTDARSKVKLSCLHQALQCCAVLVAIGSVSQESPVLEYWPRIGRTAKGREISWEQ